MGMPLLLWLQDHPRLTCSPCRWAHLPSSIPVQEHRAPSCSSEPACTLESTTAWLYQL